MNQRIDTERANHIAKFLKNEIPTNQNREYPVQTNINVSRLYGLVH
jgi:hypothetical protein